MLVNGLRLQEEFLVSRRLLARVKMISATVSGRSKDPHVTIFDSLSSTSVMPSGSTGREKNTPGKTQELASSHGLRASPRFMASIRATVFSQFSWLP